MFSYIVSTAGFIICLINEMHQCTEVSVLVFFVFSVMENLVPQFHSAVRFTKKYCGNTMVQ